MSVQKDRCLRERERNREAGGGANTDDTATECMSASFDATVSDGSGLCASV